MGVKGIIYEISYHASRIGFVIINTYYLRRALQINIFVFCHLNVYSHVFYINSINFFTLFYTIKLLNIILFTIKFFFFFLNLL